MTRAMLAVDTGDLRVDAATHLLAVCRTFLTCRTDLVGAVTLDGAAGAAAAGLAAGAWVPVEPVCARTGAANTDAATSATAIFFNIAWSFCCPGP